MTDGLPRFEDVCALTASPKPPLAARVIERRGGEVLRSASVIHDGMNAWYVDDGQQVELRPAEDRAVLVEGGAVERFGPGMVVSAHNWVKTAIDGRRLAYLDEASGEVTGREVVDGRDCWVVRASGLKRGQEDATALHVDAETGVLMRIAREGREGTTLEVESLRLGTTHERGR